MLGEEDKMNFIHTLANQLANTIQDLGEQISQLLTEVTDVMARMNTTNDSYRRLAAVFGPPLVWDNGIVVPQPFEEHSRSRRFFDMLSQASFVLSMAYLIIGCYFSITDDWLYLIGILIIAIAVGWLWHAIFRSAAYRVFKLVPERSGEASVATAEATAVGLALAGFIAALIFAIGRATGDESSWITDYFLESLFICDALLLTASGIAHAVGDYYRWSEDQAESYEADRKSLFRLREQISKLTALLSHDLKRFRQVEEVDRPPVTLTAEVTRLLHEFEEQRVDDRIDEQDLPKKERLLNEEITDEGNDDQNA